MEEEAVVRERLEEVTLNAEEGARREREKRSEGPSEEDGARRTCAAQREGEKEKAFSREWAQIHEVEWASAETRR